MAYRPISFEDRWPTFHEFREQKYTAPAPRPAPGPASGAETHMIPDQGLNEIIGMIVEHGLNRSASFFGDLLYVPEGSDWTLSKWLKAKQRASEAERLVYALL